MPAKKYRKRSEDVEAIQYDDTEEREEEIKGWSDGQCYGPGVCILGLDSMVVKNRQGGTLALLTG